MTDSVCRLANEEDLAVKKIHDANGVDQIEEAGKAEEKVFDSLLSAMAEELNKKPDKNDKERQACSHQGVGHSP